MQQGDYVKTLIVYDSVYHNTEKIALAIGTAFPAGSVKVLKAGAVHKSDLEGVNLFIVGSPTQGGRATQALQTFFGEIPEKGLKNVAIAAFDTRMTGEKNSRAMRMFVKLFGWAAGRIAETLKSKGGNLIVSPEGFIVEGRKGPLKAGETERAAAWGKQIFIKLQSSRLIAS